MSSSTNKVSQKFYGCHHNFSTSGSHNTNDDRFEELIKKVKNLEKAIKKLKASDAEKDKRIKSLEYQLAVKDKRIEELEGVNKSTMTLLREVTEKLEMHRNSQGRRDGRVERPDVIPPGYTWRRPCTVRAHHRSGGLVRLPAGPRY